MRKSNSVGVAGEKWIEQIEPSNVCKCPTVMNTVSIVLQWGSKRYCGKGGGDGGGR